MSGGSGSRTQPARPLDSFLVSEPREITEQAVEAAVDAALAAIAAAGDSAALKAVRTEHTGESRPSPG